MSAVAFSLPPRPLLSRRSTLFPLHERRLGLARHHDRLSPSRKCHLYRCRCPGLNSYAAGTITCNQVKVEDDVDDETCELVNGVDLTIGDDQDSIRAYLLKAVKNNNGTGVLLLSDIFGFEDSSTRDFAYRVACNGYNVLVPDLFRENPWKQGQPFTEFEQWLTTHTPSMVAKDIDAAAKWLIDEFAAAGISKKLGIVGFCFGGGKLVETLARDRQAHFGTGVCFYGSRIVTSLARDIRVPVLFISGDKDDLCPIDGLREMEKCISGSRVVVYHGRGHGFVHRPDSQEDDEDAEDAFAIMRSWLADSLMLSKNHVL